MALFAQLEKDGRMPARKPVDTFELRRQSDPVVYRFERQTDDKVRVGFKRTDGDYWIVYHKRHGWIAGSWDTNDVFGRPWNLSNRQSDHAPPEGVWVSRKGPKSYVYDLVHT